VTKQPIESGDWSSASEALFRSARGAHGPNPRDRDRVRNALAQRLAEVSNAPIAGAVSRLSGATKSGVALSTLAMIGVGLVAVIAGLVVFLRTGDSSKHVDSIPGVPASAEAARIAERAAASPVAEAFPAVQPNSEPFAVAVKTDSAASAVRRARERASVAVGSARVQSGAKASEARTRERTAARKDAPAPVLATDDSTALAPAQSSGSAARTSAQSSGSAARTSAQSSGSTGRASAQSSGSTARKPARTAGASATLNTARVEQDSTDRVAPGPEAEDSAKATAAQTEQDSASRATANAQLDPSDPRAELFFLRRIQAALRAAEPREVLSLCAEHERRWPLGTFVQEREGLRAIASCQSNARDAGARASAFFVAYPRGPLAPRVRAACASRLPVARPEARTPASGAIDR
jgi:hypothetical protein